MFKLKRGIIEVSGQQSMDDLVTEFFTEVIGQPKERNKVINLDAMQLPRLNLDDSEANFTEEEICAVVKNLPTENC